jgi:hypothetical protein
MWFPSKTRVLGSVMLVSVLGGCSEFYYDRRESVSLGAGDSVATNKVIHTVDPWPANVGNQNIASNGQRMQAAQERYRQNKVTPTVGISTSSTAYQRAADPAAPAASAAPVAAPAP